MYRREHCHCLCLQEIHRATHLARPKIAGMTLIAERPHNKYGSAVLLRDDLKVKSIYVSVQGEVELITAVLPGVVVHSVYKPPNEPFVLPVVLPNCTINLGTRSSPAHRNWRLQQPQYDMGIQRHRRPNPNPNGEAVEHWADTCNLTLIHNAKLPKSFNSARWKKGYNPDLIFASANIANVSGKSVMYPNPHTQHRPICVHMNPS